MKKLILAIIFFAFAFMFTACNDLSSPDYSDENLSQSSSQTLDSRVNRGNGKGTAQPHGNALDGSGKIYVCKFTRTPGGEEVLKRGNQGLVHVDPNSQRNNLPNFPEVLVGDQWQDRHGFSTVIDPSKGADALKGLITAEVACTRSSSEE